MKKNRIAITALNFLRACAVPMAMLVAVSLVAQNAPYDSAKPLPHATVFAPGIISTGDYESHATFTPDGREIYFLKMAPNFSRWTIFASRYKDGGWSQPEVASFSGQTRTPIPTSPLMDNIFISSPIARSRRRASASRITTSG